MCLFGCDKLYEEGYIFITKRGEIKKSGKLVTNKMEDYIKKLVGNKCRDFNEARKKYFKWHREYHKKRFKKDNGIDDIR